MLDEPINGLDPDGVIWVRHLLRSLADQGRTVFVSSHLMSEVAQTADHLVVIGRGRLVADVPTEELLQAGTPSVTVRAVEAATLASLLTAKGAGVERPAAELLEVRDLSAHDIAQVALDHRLLVHELTQHNRSLEEAFMDLTHADVEFQGADVAAGGPDMTTISTTTIGTPTLLQTLHRAVTSEVIKLRTVRSSVWLLVAATAFTLLWGRCRRSGRSSRVPPPTSRARPTPARWPCPSP